MFFLQQLQSNLVSLMRTDRHLFSLRSGHIHQMLFLCCWQRAVSSSLHIKEMYGKTPGWRRVSGLNTKTQDADKVREMHLCTNIAIELKQRSKCWT